MCELPKMAPTLVVFSALLLFIPPPTTLTPVSINTKTSITETDPTNPTTTPKTKVSIVSTATPSVISTSASTTNTSYLGADDEVAQTRPEYLALTPFEEKLESLSCDLPVIPNEYRIWKSNQTHELLLPITLPPENCSNNIKPDQKNSNDSNGIKSPPALNCQNKIPLSWNGDSEIQSGDVLLVRIDDFFLVSEEEILKNNSKKDHQEKLMHEPVTSVYQVTRTGHDKCDVTEGVLMDITPLKVNNEKLVTLYDKDLTLGTNLLIVVSELWGAQCVRLKVTVKSDNCGENEDCSRKGVCFSNISMDGYECQCCLGFIGQHCEERDACYPSPCRNSGICVDISQGHEGSTYQCLCPYGYTGRTCDEQTDPCTSNPCQNGASCVGNATHFKCVCLDGFTGTFCQHSHNDCQSSPCVHGICVGQEDGYNCYCQPGFTGTHCEYEYNECGSSPCSNGGTCTDRVDNYECNCGRGYAGKRCEIKVDLCELSPCPEPRYCVDHGNNYSCECPLEYSGSDCIIATRVTCRTNPCTNGGTCWSNLDSYYCACKPGFTGKICEDELVVETVNEETLFTEEELNLETPISIHLDHIHSIYVATGTLVCAVVIVALIVVYCHCRTNKVYRRFFLHTYLKTRKQKLQPSTSMNREWFTGKDKAPTATPGRSIPSLDTTDLYYTLDVTESQSSPLIK